jgi:glycosyltransferase involved in cell wall biosynthesis
MAPEQERDIDILVVSNWAPFKRHWALFAALAQLPAHWRVVCVGQPETGSSLAKIQALQTRFGVKQRIEYHERLSIDEVTALQLRSKVGAVFSRHEGCCVAAAETLMAGCSLALIDGAKVGPLAYVTEQTGVAMRSGSISADLARAVEQAHLRSPRQFAEQHVSCLVSAQKLNAQLLSEAAREGRPWTRDIQTPVWRPYPRLLREVPPDIQQAADELSALYPSVFPPTFLNTSHR